jgi:hypothetical protein
MRRLLPVAPIIILAVAYASSAVCAQRGGGRGGFSGHSPPSFHGGFSGSAPAFHGPALGGFASSPRYGVTAPPRYGFTSAAHYGFGISPNTRFNPSPRYPVSGNNAVPRFNGLGFRASGIAGNIANGSVARSGFAGANLRRMPYRPPYTRDPRFNRNNRFNGGVVWPGWPNTYGVAGYPGLLDYPPDWNYGESDNSSGSQGYAPQDYGSQSPDQQQPEYAPPPAWPSSYVPQNSSQSPAQEAEPVTLVFNDGRPPVKIHDYLLTRATLYVEDKHRSEIPVAELDLAATAKVNREVGIDFKIPGSPR